MLFTLLFGCRRRTYSLSLVFGMMLCAACGCGEGAATGERSSPQADTAKPGSLGDARETDPSSSGGNDDELRSRTRWVGDIPYDVFFDDPVAVAADSRSVEQADHGIALSHSPRDGNSASAVGSSVSDAAGPASASVAAAGAASSPAGNGTTSRAVDWQQLADIEALNDEVKQIRNRLTAHLRTVAAYNQSLEDVRNDAIILAALAAVVIEHPGSLSWQEKAPWVRDLAIQIASEAESTGRQAFSQAQISFEQLTVILDGGPPPDGDAASDVPFREIADRSELMKRIKRSFDWLKAEINTDARFRESRSGIARDAALLAALGGIVSTDSYDSTDEDAYQKHVREFIAGSMGMGAATSDGSYEQFITARDRVQNSCAACHGDYALGDEGL